MINLGKQKHIPLKGEIIARLAWEGGQELLFICLYGHFNTEILF